MYRAGWNLEDAIGLGGAGIGFREEFGLPATNMAECLGSFQQGLAALQGRFGALAQNEGGENVRHRDQERLLRGVSPRTGRQVKHQHADDLALIQQGQAVVAVIGHARIDDLVPTIEMIGENDLAAGRRLTAQAVTQRQIAALVQHTRRQAAGDDQSQMPAVFAQQVNAAARQHRQPRYGQQPVQAVAERRLQRAAAQDGFEQLPQRRLLLAIALCLQLGELALGDVDVADDQPVDGSLEAVGAHGEPALFVR